MYLLQICLNKNQPGEWCNEGKRRLTNAEKLSRSRARRSDAQREIKRKEDRERKAKRKREMSEAEKIIQNKKNRDSHKQGYQSKLPEERRQVNEKKQQKQEERDPGSPQAVREKKSKRERDKRARESAAEATARKKRRKAAESRTRAPDEDFKESVDRAVKEALKFLHRTKFDDEPDFHQAYVCIICDCVIKGTESLCSLSDKQIKANSHRISVKKYEAFQNTSLPKELIKQYHVRNLPGLLLSPMLHVPHVLKQ